MAKVIANGQGTEVSLPCRLDMFLERLGWKATQVVVELNGTVIERAKVGQVEVKEGDRIEVIVPVAGG
jgi:thiamine biosynthesis protein ThiS